MELRQEVKSQEGSGHLSLMSGTIIFPLCSGWQSNLHGKPWTRGLGLSQGHTFFPYMFYMTFRMSTAKHIKILLPLISLTKVFTQFIVKEIYY